MKNSYFSKEFNNKKAAKNCTFQYYFQNNFWSLKTVERTAVLRQTFIFPFNNSKISLIIVEFILNFNIYFHFHFSIPCKLSQISSNKSLSCSVFFFLEKKPRSSNPKEQCSSRNKLIMKFNMSRHQKLHAKRCSQCSQSFPEDEKLQRHIASVHSPSLIIKKKFSCSSCPLSFSTYYQLLNDKRKSHQHSIPRTYEEVDLSIYGDSPALHSELQTVQHFLRDSVLELSRKKVHNFKITEINHETVIEKLDCVYNELPSSAKINISFGFVLQSVQNPEEFRYYYAADNNPVFLNPMVLADDSDLNFIKSILREDEILPNLINQRPDTKWKFYCVTNVTFFVFLLSGVPLGCITQNVPSILLRNGYIKSFVSDCERSAAKTTCVCSVHWLTICMVVFIYNKKQWN